MKFLRGLFRKVAPPSESEQLLQTAMEAFIQAPNSYAAQRAVTVQYPILLTDSAEHYIDRLIESTPRLRSSAEKYRLVLRHCREGLATSPGELVQIIRSFVEASTLTERRHIIDEHPELLNDLADAQIERTISYQQNSEARQVLEEYRLLLRQCREKGIEHAFRESELRVENFAIPAEFESDIRRLLEMDTLYEKHPNKQILNEMIGTWEHILSHPLFSDAPPGFRLHTLNDLGAAYGRLYKATGQLEDLSRSLDFHRAVLEQTPPNSPDLPIYLANLGEGLRHKYARTADLKDLEEAKQFCQQAVTNAEPNDSNLPNFLNILGSVLSILYDVKSNPSDLECAIDSFNRATSLASLSSSEMPRYMTNLGLSLHLRYRHSQTSDLDDLQHSIQLHEQAVKLTLPDHPSLYPRMNNLGLALMDIYERNKRPVDLMRANEVYRRVAKEGLQVAVEEALRSARAWGDSAFTRKSWVEAAEAYNYAQEASEKLFKTQIMRRDKESWLRETQGLFARAAYARAQTMKIDDLKEAIVAIEVGCARLLSEALEREPADLDALQSIRPDLVECYEKFVNHIVHLDAQLDQRETRSINLTNELKEVYRELDTVISKIRHIPNFETFLLPPTFDDIKAATECGPLVYLLTTEFGSLALIVYLEHISAVELELTTAELTKIVTTHVGTTKVSDCPVEQEPNLPSSLTEISPFLYERVMKPLGDALQNIYPPLPTIEVAGRLGIPITLIPTGKLRLLPLHAAYSRINPQIRFINDFVVSYAPSGRALREAQNELLHRNSRPCLVGIGNPLPHPLPLPAAASELEEIEVLFSTIFPGNIHCALYGIDATKSALLQHLATGVYLHFACHGYFDADKALESRLELSQCEPLTLRDILYNETAQPKCARLVILSACQSAMTEFRNLPDEAIGLPLGFLQAHIPGVIGSLWPVEDRSTALLMVQFYKNHLEQAMPPPVALREAQLWLCNITRAELGKYYDSFLRISAKDAQVAQAEIMLAGDANEKPYENPFYWAAFTYNGL